MSNAATRSQTRTRIGRAVKPEHDSAEIAAIHAKLKELEAVIKSMAGADGKDGKDGAPGKDGIDGKDGAPGKDGTDGKDGAPGKDGTDGKNGDREIVFTGSGTPAIYMRILQSPRAGHALSGYVIPHGPGTNRIRILVERPNKNPFKFSLPIKTAFARIQEYIGMMQNCNPKTVVLHHKGQVLAPTHTPLSVGAPVDDELHLQMMQ